MALIYLNGLVTTVPVVSGVYTVTSIEADGATITANAIAPHGVRVSLTICDTGSAVEVGYFTRTKTLSIYEKGAFVQSKKASVTDQVRYALAGL